MCGGREKNKEQRGGPKRVKEKKKRKGVCVEDGTFSDLDNLQLKLTRRKSEAAITILFLTPTPCPVFGLFFLALSQLFASCSLTLCPNTQHNQFPNTVARHGVTVPSYKDYTLGTFCFIDALREDLLMNFFPYM